MSRKYGQKGYMDDDARERGPRGPRPKKEGPRGRGLGAPTASVFRCAVCAAKQETFEVALDAVCTCGRDLHTCTHCAYFDTSATFECTQDIPERIASKTKRNECELFAPKIAKEFDKGHASATDAKKAFDDLFDL